MMERTWHFKEARIQRRTSKYDLMNKSWTLMSTRTLQRSQRKASKYKKTTPVKIWNILSKKLMDLRQQLPKENF